jgi:hypothetical protein
VRKVLRDLEKLLQKHDDKIIHLNEYKCFIEALVKTRRFIPDLPLVEIITVLRHERPTIFYVVQKQAAGNMQLEMVTSLEGDYEEAKQELTNLTKKVAR